MRRKYILSENTIDCPSCDGDGTFNCSGYGICLDCDGEGKVHDEFWEMDFVKHKHQDIQGWIVGFDGEKAIVEVVEDDENETRLIYRVEELEHAQEE